MNREVHVRFWEGLRVRFPRATHFAEAIIVHSSFLELQCAWSTSMKQE